MASHWAVYIYYVCMYVRIVTHPMLGWSGYVESYCYVGLWLHSKNIAIPGFEDKLHI